MAFPTVTDQFSYGAVTLSYATTKVVNQRAVYDPTDTDLIYTTSTLAVEGVLAYNIPPATPGQQPADVMRDLYHYLHLPQLPLRYRVGGRTVIAIDPPDGAPVIGGSKPPPGQIGFAISKDAANGPKPRNVRFGAGVGAGTVEGGIGVEFEVDVNHFDCRSGAAERRGFASNRYEVEEEYDACGYCTLRTTGLIVCRSDLRLKPQQLFAVAAPPVRPGYQRENWRFGVSGDGLKLQYSFTEKEYYLPAPGNGIVLDGEMRIFNPSGGGRYIGLAHISLRGGRDIARNELGALAGKIANAHINKFAIKGANQKSPMSAVTYGFKVARNEVYVTVQCTLDPLKVQGKFNPVLARLKGAPFDADLFNPPKIPELDRVNEPAQAPPIRGQNDLHQIALAVFQNPCGIGIQSVRQNVQQQGDSGQGILIGGGPVPPWLIPGGGPPSPPDPLSPPPHPPLPPLSPGKSTP